MTHNYYAENLHSERLYQVYQTKLPRVSQYLAAEIDFVKMQLTGKESLLEMGAGYGRIMKELAPHAASLTGIDISESSVALGKNYLKDHPNCRLMTMDCHHLDFEAEFDLVLCLQNGLSSMKGVALNLLHQAMSVLKPGGTAFFSTYSPAFWDHRLAWFQEQATKGLLGQIDLDQTKSGLIVCKDGFVATTYSPEALAALAQALGYPYRITEVDHSSIFLILEKH